MNDGGKWIIAEIDNMKKWKSGNNWEVQTVNILLKKVRRINSIVVFGKNLILAKRLIPKKQRLLTK